MLKPESKQGQATKSGYADRLFALREAMRAHRLDAYLLLAGDEHMNEYLPKNRQRRAWLSCFTGSAGDILVGLDEAWVFADSRYHEQADQEVDTEQFHISKLGQSNALAIEGVLARWLEMAQNQPLQDKERPFRLGLDAACAPVGLWDKLEKQLEAVGAQLVTQPCNLIDTIWLDAPAMPAQPIIALPLSASGQSAVEKLSRVRKAIQKEKAELLPITRLDQIAWLLNLRGDDIPYNPLFIAYALLDTTQDKLLLFTNPDRLTPEASQAIADIVEIYPYAAYDDILAQQARGGRSVLVDVRHTTQLTVQIAQETGARLVRAMHPIEGMKAIKNPTELQAMEAANFRASRGKIRAWFWLEQALAKGESVTEASFRDAIEGFYAEEADFAGLSFNTISGAGANGSIVHYGTPSENKRLESGELFLIDSGCQFFIGGTTDDTRTWLIGETASDLQRLRYTEVLKAHVNVAMQRFPAGTDGARLDGICRASMWQSGLDYGHGTGHGVGAFLNVHEGPNGIHRSASTPLEPGMITSIEPGFYEPGWGGIRLENLYQVVSLPPIEGESASTVWLGFESLTLIPFERKLVDVSRLSAAQREWLHAYHHRIVEQVASTLPDEEASWLQRICDLA
jgi:Xaa-Pro aminopeptidase